MLKIFYHILYQISSYNLKFKFVYEIIFWVNKTALDLALEKKYTEIVQLLINHPQIDQNDKRRFNLIVHSIIFFYFFKYLHE